MEKPIQYTRYMWENSLKQILDYIETMEKKLDYLKKEIEGYRLFNSEVRHLGSLTKEAKNLYRRCKV